MTERRAQGHQEFLVALGNIGKRQRLNATYMTERLGSCLAARRPQHFFEPTSSRSDGLGPLAPAHFLAACIPATPSQQQLGDRLAAAEVHVGQLDDQEEEEKSM